MAVAAEEVVAQIDGNGDPFIKRQFAGGCGYGEAEGGHDDAEADGFEQCGFAGHVGACEEQDLFGDPDIVFYGSHE